MARALSAIADLGTRAAVVGVSGNREYNPGWHTALDLPHLLTVAEAVTRSAIERRESRGGHFRDDYPAKDAAFGQFNICVRQGSGGGMELSRVAIPPMPPELAGIVEEMA